MVRMFKTHKIRRSIELEGLWEFEACGTKTNMPVPGCWEMHPDFRQHRGKAVYKKNVDLPDCNLLLKFKGISHTADISFDEHYLGQHYNAYTPFTYTIKNVEAGIHSITALVDNSYHEHSSLHIPNDYFTYGGIIRPVVLECVNDIYIERLECITSYKNECALLNINIYIKVLTKTNSMYKLTCEINGVCFDFEFYNNEEEIILTKEIDIPEVEAWSTQNPKLYMLEAVLWQNGIAVDDYIERIGFRTVEVVNKEILLNGEALKIKGFNRHEDHPMFGAALPFLTHIQDLQIMRETGANAVRTSHYPNDELFLDLCDELGFLVWEECHARGLNEKQMQHPDFDSQSEACIKEMITEHFNHPSIIIWGLLNECASWSKYGRECFKKQILQIKSMDSSRPVTYATCHFMSDICLDLVDILSYNIYSGWYEERDTGDFLEKVFNWADKNGGNNKPCIISEFGAGAIYGFRDSRRVKWSEERQADILEDNLKIYCNHNEVSGVFIWQFCDCRVSDENFYARPKTRNNKGIVDEYRRPKLCFDIVKKYFN